MKPPPLDLKDIQGIEYHGMWRGRHRWTVRFSRHDHVKVEASTPAAAVRVARRAKSEAA